MGLVSTSIVNRETHYASHKAGLKAPRQKFDSKHSEKKPQATGKPGTKQPVRIAGSTLQKIKIQTLPFKVSRQAETPKK